MPYRIRNLALVAAGLAVLYAGGLAVRRRVLGAQRTVVTPSADLMFTLESALHFRRVQTLFAGGRLPDRDPDVQYPDGVDVRRTYTVGSEYVQAALARWLPGRLSLAARLRWIEAGWFCLGIPLVALWIGGWRRSAAAGAAAGAVYAVSLAAVIRSTGQELSRENFALPLLAAHLAAEAWAGRAGSGRRGWGLGAVSAAALALALVSWDLIQYYLVLWAAAGAARAVAGWNDPTARLRQRVWLMQWAAVVAAGLVHPYFRSRGFVLSPPMLLAHGAALLSVAREAGWRPGGASARTARTLLVAGVVVLAPLAAVWLAGAYRESYGHFAGLLWAKLRFLNRKPADPALLTFEQRIMWVPALHSASWRLTWTLFPASLWVSIILLPFALADARIRSDGRTVRLVFFGAATLFTYCLFVRFHVFLVLFVSALTGLAAGWAVERRGWRRWAPLILLGTGVVVEGAQTVERPWRWGRVGMYYREESELVEWLAGHVRPAPVLAEFGVSGTILAYGGCPVLLHPKFESADIRRRVREYGEELFKGTETSFRDWADREGAVYYVHARGELATSVPAEYQMRYCVDALTPPPEAPVWRFERAPERLEHFRMVWQNRVFRVFRIRTLEDRARARVLSRLADEALQRGDLAEAEAVALDALTLDPRNERALRVVDRVDSLRRGGFGHGGS